MYAYTDIYPRNIVISPDNNRTMRIKEGKKKRFLPFLIDVTLANSMTFRELSFFCCFCSRNNVGYVSFFYQTVRHWLTALHVCRGIFRLIEQYVYTHDCSRSSWKVPSIALVPNPRSYPCPLIPYWPYPCPLFVW